MFDTKTPAEAIASLFADRHGVKPTVKIDPKMPPCWNSTTNTIYLPGWPAEGLSPSELQQLRAYLWHEAAGEQALNTWHTDPRLSTTRRKRLANGIGDAFLDLSIGEDRPGAGADIRREVRKDFDRMVAESQKSPIQPTVGLAGCLCRYIGEGVTSWNEVRQSVAVTDPDLFDYVEKAMPTGRRPKDAADVIALTLAVDAALDEYLKQDEPENPQPNPNGSGKDRSDSEAEGDADDSDADGDETDGEAEGEGSDDGEAGDGDDGDSEAGDSGTGDAEGDSGTNSGKQGSGEADGNGGGDGDTPAPPSDEPLQSNDSEQAGAGGSGASQGGGKQDPKPRPAEDVFDNGGQDSGDRVADSLRETLTGGAGNEPARLQIPEDTLKDEVADEKAYRPDGTIKAAAAALANLLRLALSAPTMATDRFQEVGRLDSRRLAAGMAGTRSIYQRRREIPGQSVAIDMVVDASGSMDSANRIGAARRLAATLMLAIDKLPDVKLNVSGFTTGYSHYHGVSPSGQIQTACRIITVKTYDEVVGKGMGRLGSLIALSGTPTMQAMYAGLRRLMRRQERRRILFILTDGAADYHEVSTNNPWKMNPTKFLAERAAAAGIEVVVFGIDTSARCFADCGLQTVQTSGGTMATATAKQLVKLLTVGSRKIN